MTTWQSGYVTDLGYTFGFYRELTPALLAFVVSAGGKHHLNASAPLNYCELGFGQGFSTNLLAAANPHITFHANDFNPSHVVGAQALALQADLSNVTFYDCSFAEFADAPGLPATFDIIALHGIYSWVNAENRQAILKFIRRKLKVGGLVYISYNCLPGWSVSAPMRQLMYFHGKNRGGATAARIDPAFAFVEELIECDAAYFRANPSLKRRFEKTKIQQRSYLAHEYLNDTWSLFYHADVVDDMSTAKLTFIGSANVLDYIDAINLSVPQQKILGRVEDTVFKETVRDFLVNQQFRRDIYVKGPLPVGARVNQAWWLEQRFALSTPRPDVEMKVRGAQGDVELQVEVYAPVLDGFSDGPRSLRELMDVPSISTLGLNRVRQAILILVGAGHLQPCLSTKDLSNRTRTTKRFNQVVIERAKDGAELNSLASPVTSGGVTVGRFAQLFLLAQSNNRKLPGDWADFAWRILASQNQRILKDGKQLETAEENLAELRTQATFFAERQLPVLRSLGIA